MSVNLVLIELVASKIVLFVQRAMVDHRKQRILAMVMPGAEGQHAVGGALEGLLII